MTSEILCYVVERVCSLYDVQIKDIKTANDNTLFLSAKVKEDDKLSFFAKIEYEFNQKVLVKEHDDDSFTIKTLFTQQSLVSH